MRNQIQLRNQIKTVKKQTGNVGRPKVFVYPEEIKPRLYFYLDDVIANIKIACQLSGLELEEFKLQPGMYSTVLPYEGAIQSINMLIKEGCDIWLITTIPEHNPGIAGEKLHWISQYLPTLMKKVIIRPQGKLGTETDLFIDNRAPNSKNDDIAGRLLNFGTGKTIQDWESLLGHINDILNLGLATDSRYSAML